MVEIMISPLPCLHESLRAEAEIVKEQERSAVAVNKHAYGVYVMQAAAVTCRVADALRCMPMNEPMMSSWLPANYL